MLSSEEYIRYADEAGRTAGMEKALRMIGYSAKTGQPRFGPKAQTARWGLGEDTLPVGDESLGEQTVFSGNLDLARDIARGK